MEDGPKGIDVAEPAGANGPHEPGPDGKVELTTDERRLVAARVGRMRAYVKAAVDAGDWAVVDMALAALKAEEQALDQRSGRRYGDALERRISDLERAFAAIIAGLQPAGQRHPSYDAIVKGSPLRYTFVVSRDGKINVNFIPLERAE